MRSGQNWVFKVLLTCFVVLAACSQNSSNEPEEDAGERMAEDIDVIIPAASAAVAEVTSVQFALVRSGAPAYIDPLETLSLLELEGRFVTPADADALLTVEVGGALTTQLGAIALGSEAWLSNPITGRFEPLPESYGIDPSLFFDPKGGWKPLLDDLEDPELVGLEELDDGPAYHIRGTAPADRIQRVTANLVTGQDVLIDVWVDPVTALIDAVEFDTVLGGETSSWALTLTGFGEPYEILPPDQRE